MSTPIHSDSCWRDTFLESAARMFFAYAYMSYVDDEERDENEDDYVYPRAGSGEDWMDYAPKATPPAAYALAGELWATVERANGHGMYTLGMFAAKADGDTSENPQVDPEEWATGLAWMFIGAGPSWFDDHESFNVGGIEFAVPEGEVSGFTFDTAAYRE